MGARSVLLEPWYSFRLEAPAGSMGRAMTDLQRMGAELPHIGDGRAGEDAQMGFFHQVGQNEPLPVPVQAPAGTVCAAAGLTRTRAGQGLGAEEDWSCGSSSSKIRSWASRVWASPPAGGST